MALQKEESDLIAEEVEYVQGLRATCQVFIKPLRAKKSGWGFSSNRVKKLEAVFTNFENIANMHSMFVADLQKPDADVVKTFVKYFEFMKIYIAYHKDFDEQYALITEVAKTKKEFKEFLNKKKDECGVDLVQAFFSVILRISQYEIVLRRLHKTSKNPMAKETADKFQKFAKNLVETRKGAVDNSTQGILEVHEKIKGSPFKHLLQPHRKFLREEKFTTPEEGEKWFALFNDLIIWTDDDYVYEGHFSLKETKLKKNKEKTPDKQYYFRLECGGAALQIYNPSRQVLDLWAEDIEKSIVWSEQHKGKIKRDSVIPLKDAEDDQIAAKKQKEKKQAEKKLEEKDRTEIKYRTDPAPLHKISKSNVLLSRYLPRIVLERIIATDKNLSDQVLGENGTLLPKDVEYQILNNASVLIADVSGFTNLNEKMKQSLGEGGAEEVSAHLNEYFTVLLNIIGKHGGDCVKFAGDALIVLFARESHLLRQQEQEREREQKRTARGLPPLSPQDSSSSIFLQPIPSTASGTSSLSSSGSSNKSRSSPSTSQTVPTSSSTSQTLTQPPKATSSGIFAALSASLWGTEPKSDSKKLEPLKGTELDDEDADVSDDISREINRRGKMGLEHDALVADGLDPTVSFKARDTLRATQCALELQEKAGIHDAGDVKLQLHIAVASGTVYAWHVGGHQGEWEFLILGDPFAQLARGVELSKTGDVVISKKSWGLISKYAKGQALPKSVCKTGEVKVEAVTHPLIPKAIPSLPREVYNNQLISEAQRSYLSRCVLDKIDAGQGEWIAELRQASVVFVNLTGLVLNRDLRRLEQEAKQVHWICQSMQAVIQRNQGYRRQFLVDDKGTVLIVVFGVPPYAHEDDAFRAVKSALEIRDVLVDEGVQHGIGIATGDVYVGSVGALYRQEHAVVGDTVNLAARLSGRAVKDEIGLLIDQASFDKVRSQIKCRDVGSIKVKGKDEMIKTYCPETLDLVNALSREIAGPGETISRNDENTVIMRALKSLQNDGERNGEGQIILVEGPAGIGKTQLIRNFYRLAQQNVTAFYVAGMPTETTSFLSIWRDLIEQMAGITKINENDVYSAGVKKSKKYHRDVRRRTKAVLKFIKSITAAKTDPRVPLLNALLMTQIAPNEMTRKIDDDAEKLKYHTMTLLFYIIECVLQKKKTQQPKPLCLFIEDVHLIENDSLSVLLHVAALAAIQPLLIVVSARPINKSMKVSNHQWVEGRKKLTHLPKFLRMKLEGLKRKDTERLVLQSLSIKSIPEKILDLIMDRSKGNPLYALEVAVHLRDSGTMEIKDDGNCVTDEKKLQQATETLLPSSLTKLVTKRIDKLPLMESLVCKLASAYGEEFDVRFLRMLFHKEHERAAKEGDDFANPSSPRGTPQTPSFTTPPSSSNSSVPQTPSSIPNSSSWSSVPPSPAPGRRLGGGVAMDRRRLDDELDNTLHSLVKKEILRQRTETYRRRGQPAWQNSSGRRDMYAFAQTAFRRACYKLLLYSQRRRLHYEIAEILEKYNSDDVSNDDMRAWHYTQALKASNPNQKDPQAQKAEAAYGTAPTTQTTIPGAAPPPLDIGGDGAKDVKEVGDEVEEAQMQKANQFLKGQNIVRKLQFMYQARLEEIQKQSSRDFKSPPTPGSSGGGSLGHPVRSSPNRTGDHKDSARPVHNRSAAALFNVSETPREKTALIEIVQEDKLSNSNRRNSIYVDDDSGRGMSSGRSSPSYSTSEIEELEYSNDIKEIKETKHESRDFSRSPPQRAPAPIPTRQVPKINPTSPPPSTASNFTLSPQKNTLRSPSPQKSSIRSPSPALPMSGPPPKPKPPQLLETKPPTPEKTVRKPDKPSSSRPAPLQTSTQTSPVRSMSPVKYPSNNKINSSNHDSSGGSHFFSTGFSSSSSSASASGQHGPLVPTSGGTHVATPLPSPRSRGAGGGFVGGRPIDSKTSPGSGMKIQTSGGFASGGKNSSNPPSPKSASAIPTSSGGSAIPRVASAANLSAPVGSGPRRDSRAHIPNNVVSKRMEAFNQRFKTLPPPTKSPRSSGSTPGGSPGPSSPGTPTQVTPPSTPPLRAKPAAPPTTKPLPTSPPPPAPKRIF